MVFAIKGNVPLSAKVDIRLTPDEKLRLQADAEAAGISTSELVRRQYFNRPILPATDLRTIRELNRLGGLLKHTHNVTNGAHADATADVLAQIGAYIKTLTAAANDR